MFEDSTFESNGRIHTRSRIWGLAAFVINGSILAAMVVIPLLYPEALPRHLMNMLLVAPPPPPSAPKPPEVRRAQVFQGHEEFVDMRLTAPRQIPPTIREITSETLPIGTAIPGLGDNNTFPSGVPFGHGSGSQPHVVSGPAPGPQRITSRLAEGMLINRVMPVYPPIPRTAGVQGTVVLEATISTHGTIENLHVLSGPLMLQQAAIDAVSRWRYRPYLLNGQPVEVETTVSVVFSLGQQ